MKRLKTVTALLLTLCLLLGMLPISVLAAEPEANLVVTPIEATEQASENGTVKMYGLKFTATVPGGIKAISILLSYDPSKIQPVYVADGGCWDANTANMSTETYAFEITGQSQSTGAPSIKLFNQPAASWKTVGDRVAVAYTLADTRTATNTTETQDMFNFYYRLQDGVKEADLTAGSIRIVTDPNTAEYQAHYVVSSTPDYGVRMLAIDGSVYSVYAFGENKSASYSLTHPGSGNKDAYTGTQASAPTVSSKKGADVTLNANAAISGETVEYAYGTTNSAPTSEWQTSTNFTGLAAGTYYFFARVAENSDHKAGMAVVSKAVTVYAAPSISYGEIPAMTIDTAIAPLSPKVTGGANAASDAYRITTGALPAGLTIDANTGVISGTPTTAGAAGQVTVTYTDEEGQTATAVVNYGAVSKKAGELTITCANTVFGTAPNPQVGTNASNGAVTFTYSTTADGTYGEWDTSNPVGTYYVKGTAAATDKYEEAVSAPVAFRVTAADITGTVTITGNAVYGETLTANTSNIPGTPVYQWYRGENAIDGATQSTYKLTTADIGSTISVKVSDSSGNYGGTVDSAATSAVAKATYSGSVTGAATVHSDTYDKNGTTDYTYALSGLTGLPADITGIGYDAVTVTANGDNLISGTPTVEGGSLKYTVAPKAAGTTATITVVVTSENYDDIAATITVTSADKQPATVTLEDSTVTYDGQPHSLTPVWPEGSGTKTVTYVKDGQGSTTAPTDAGTYMVTAVYENDTHYGADTATLTIEKLEAELVWEGDKDLVYDGTAKNVTASVNNKVADDDVAVTVDGGNATNAGDHTATATGLSNPNYKLPAAATREYTIAPKVTTFNVTLEPDSFEYDGTTKQPTTVTVKDGETVLAVNTDYTVTFPDNSTDYGTYTVTVAGQGNYEGSTGSATYQITKNQQSALVISNVSGKTYGDSEFEIYITGGSGTGEYSLISSDETVLKLDRVQNSGNAWIATILKAGTVTLTANKAGDNNYEAAEEVTASVTIAAKTLSEGMVTLSGNSFEYTGSAIEPAVTVVDGGKALVKDTDYTVKYSGDCINTNTTTATVTVTGIGNYSGDIEKTFTITAKDLGDSAVISGLNETYPYTGSAIIPDFSVLDGSKTLEKGTDYDVAYSANTDLGKVTVTVTFKGNYSGTATAHFTIVAAPAEGTVTIQADTQTIEVGTKLTASVTGTYDQISYQWYRDGKAISGATGDTYKLVEADAGAKISVEATSSGNYVGTLTSDPVEVGKMTLPGTLTISGTTTNVGDTLTATMENSVDAANYTIQWYRNGVAISGATGNTYTIVKADKGDNISAIATAKGTQYTGTVTSNTIAIPATVPDAPTVTATAGDGQVTIRWTLADNGGAAITGYTIQVNGKDLVTVSGSTTSYTVTGLTNDTKYTFSVKANNAVGTGEAGTVAATPVRTYTGGGSVSGDYIVGVKQTTGGWVTVSPGRADQGDTVTITVKPNDGYVLEDISVTDSKGNAVAVRAMDNNRFTFKMPGRQVSIEASFVKEGTEPETYLPFRDVAESDWYYDAVVYCYENDLFNGTSSTTFSPTSDMNRAMIWTVLARMEGVNTSVGGAWYQAGMTWAMANGISDGTNPNGSITREQLAVMLYRYAGSPKVSGGVTGFTDAGAISSWAEDGMAWAIEQGLISGLGNGTVAPQKTATRAEVATILMRFDQAYGA